MAAAASSASGLAAAHSGSKGQRKTAADKVGNYACSTRLCIPLGGGGAVPFHMSTRKLDYTSGSLFGDSMILMQHQNNHFRVLQSQNSSNGYSSAARAAAGTVTKEPSTGIEFSNTLSPPGGGSTELSFVGAGVREKKIAFIKVKVYAVGFYVDASSLADSSVGSWKGKSGTELSKDESFFKALIEVPVEKALKIVLARDVEGSQFWGALDEALTPRLKRAGPAGQQALSALGNVFKGRALKQGTTVILTWTQPATLHISISSSTAAAAAAAAPDATIESAVLLSSLFDVYLGKDPVSPSAKASIANSFPSLV